jgi:hypothetical protein
MKHVETLSGSTNEIEKKDYLGLSFKKFPRTFHTSTSGIFLRYRSIGIRNIEKLLQIKSNHQIKILMNNSENIQKQIYTKITN